MYIDQILSKSAERETCIVLEPGLYEQVINQGIKKELENISSARQAHAAIDKAEASVILSHYVQEVFQKALELIREKRGGLKRQVELTNALISEICQYIEDEDLEKYKIQTSETARQLLALLPAQDPRLALGQSAYDLPRPETSIAQSSLFTGAVHEPQMFSELKKEILSADRIDMLVSFIKWSGLRLIWDELKDFTQKGGQLRIITTSYMGATDLKAIQELQKLSNCKIKVSYDTKRTRLHAKTYVFYRNTGFTTAYVGSSNLSNAAISSGLEWNVKVTAQDLPSTLQKIDATFDSYWNSNEFEFYREESSERLRLALLAEKSQDYGERQRFFFDLRPYAFQQEILDKLKADREVRNHYKNLIVSATGTGKTMIAAFDYKRFRLENQQRSSRLLFVAHREEILKQSYDSFQAVLKDANFGQLFVGNYQPSHLDHLFVSIQTANSRELYLRLPEDYYDYIVVDEFHHAAAPSYQKLLDHFKPKILLGLTATPERMDGKSILDFFDGRIAAEIRLPEAIERKLLSPFHYFGVSDTVDLDDLRWTRGAYDRSALSARYTENKEVAETRAAHIINSLERYVTDINQVKGLGFCVSVEHAHFMADFFNRHGIPSLALDGHSPQDDRQSAKHRLVSGEIRFIFVVDIYNEGVDIPEVNTVLFLRPTESLTIFLQQLGRGLRLSEGKECLTVLDFIGQANKKYNFEEKFAALLANTNHSVQYEIKNGFASAPKGCYIQLERKASEHILDNIRSSFQGKAALMNKIRNFTDDTEFELSLSNFLNFYHLSPSAIYRNYSFARLCADAGVQEDFDEALEKTVTKGLSRLAAIDSRRWIRFLQQTLPKLSSINFTHLSPLERRMLNMFYVTIWQDYVDDWDEPEVKRNLQALAHSPNMLGEIIDLLAYKFEQIDFIDEDVELGFDSPLDAYCSYTRDQIFTALDYPNPSIIREGVKWMPEKNIDVLLVTLNKSDKDYSPTTMYEDYSIDESLFHWQSQSTTSDESPTGQRYIHHQERGSKILLFVREFKTDKLGAAPYTFLGTANYVDHKGSRPMSILWKLDKPIPAKYLKKTQKMIVG